MSLRPADTDTVIDLATKLAERSRRRHRDEAAPSGLTERERSLAAVAAQIALYGGEELGVAMERALESGATPEEIADLITGLEAHVGWPAAMSAALWARDVFAKMS